MADWLCPELDGKTLLQYAHTPHFDYLARNGRNGLLKTVPYMRDEAPWRLPA